MFDEAEHRDPRHHKTWVALVDGNLTQLDILQKVARLSFEATVRAVLPWLWPLLATLALITYIPQLVLWLPGIMYPK
jgi:hypothetical protein